MNELMRRGVAGKGRRRILFAVAALILVSMPIIAQPVSSQSPAQCYAKCEIRETARLVGDEYPVVADQLKTGCSPPANFNNWIAVPEPTTDVRWTKAYSTWVDKNSIPPEFELTPDGARVTIKTYCGAEVKYRWSGFQQKRTGTDQEDRIYRICKNECLAN